MSTSGRRDRTGTGRECPIGAGPRKLVDIYELPFPKQLFLKDKGVVKIGHGRNLGSQKPGKKNVW